MRVLPIYIIVLVLFISCRSSDNWKLFVGEGIPTSHESYNDCVFKDSVTAFLGGDRMILLPESNNKQAKAKYETVLYKTNDCAKSWTKLPLNYPGSVEKIFCFNDTLIVLIQHLYTDSIYIIRSVDCGRTWKSLLIMSIKNYVRCVTFDTPNKGYVVIDEEASSQVLKLNGYAWDTILKLPEMNRFYMIINDKLITGLSQGVRFTNLETKSEKIIPFDKPVHIIFSTATDKSNAYLAVWGKNQNRILKLTEENVEDLNFGKYSEYSPFKVSVYQNTILADVSIEGVIHKYLVSKDGGKNWVMEKPLLSESSAAVLYKDKFFLTYCGAGMFQMRQ